jgi:hypothetical protein
MERQMNIINEIINAKKKDTLDTASKETHYCKTQLWFVYDGITYYWNFPTDVEIFIDELKKLSIAKDTRTLLLESNCKDIDGLLKLKAAGII